MSAAKYALKATPKRQRFKEALRQLSAVQWTEKSEQYCEYRLDGRTSGGWLRAKQFTNGTLYLEASDDGLLVRMTALLAEETAVSTTLASVTANGNDTVFAVERNAGVSGSVVSGVSPSGHVNISGDYIGTDESGKGDFFGPLVVAAVHVTDDNIRELRQLGVMDSKKLTDARIETLYTALVQVVGPEAVTTVELEPVRYNAMYEQFRQSGKNLNHLLAWGHATVLESLLERFPACHQAIADQFGNERYIISQLQTRGRGIDLRQTPRAEANVGVAAASVVARWRFTQEMKALSERFGLDLPLGAGPVVKVAARRLIATHGREALPQLVKMHFKTTAEL